MSTPAALEAPALERVPCNLCGSSDHEVVYEARADLERDSDLARKFRASGDELLTLPLVRCRACSLLFVNPRYQAGAVLDGYAAGDDPVYVSQMDARVRTFAGTVDQITRLAPARGRILDIGTAAGAFLKAAADAGWEATGIEPNGWLARWGRDRFGVTIHVGSDSFWLCAVSGVDVGQPASRHRPFVRQKRALGNLKCLLRGNIGGLMYRPRPEVERSL